MNTIIDYKIVPTMQQTFITPFCFNIFKGFTCSQNERSLNHNIVLMRQGHSILTSILMIEIFDNLNIDKNWIAL